MFTQNNGTHNHAFIRHPILMIAVFTAAYFTTISVNAQQAVGGAPDVVQIDKKAGALISGTVTSVDEQNIMIDSAGKPIRVFVGDMDLDAPADTLFKPGMNVEVRGESTGDDFGTMVVKADNVLATEATPAAPVAAQ